MNAPRGRLSAGDELLAHQLPRPVSVVHEDTATWFDRFYFCLHSPSEGTTAVIGGGVYPNVERIDGYVCLVDSGRQRNVRFSDALGDDRLRTSVGPVHWEVLDPLTSWRLVVEENEQGFAIDGVYTARTVPWLVEPIAVGHQEGPQTEFSHFFQVGHWEGTLTVDGTTRTLDGWLGARDRSWGVRRTREQLGLHMWVVAQFPDRCVAVHYNEYRDGTQHHCDGAVMPDGREPIPVRALAHDIEVEEGELVRARFMVPCEGEILELECEGLHRGLYMAPAGYGGWHGQDYGPSHVEGETTELDGTETARTLSIGLVDKACRYRLGDVAGAGFVELALSRSSSYTYRPRPVETLP